MSLLNCNRVRIREQILGKGKRSQEHNQRITSEEKKQQGTRGWESYWRDSFHCLAILPRPVSLIIIIIIKMIRLIISIIIMIIINPHSFPKLGHYNFATLNNWPRFSSHYTIYLVSIFTNKIYHLWFKVCFDLIFLPQKKSQAPCQFLKIMIPSCRSKEITILITLEISSSENASCRQMRYINTWFLIFAGKAVS